MRDEPEFSLASNPFRHGCSVQLEASAWAIPLGDLVEVGSGSDQLETIPFELVFDDVLSPVVARLAVGSRHRWAIHLERVGETQGGPDIPNWARVQGQLETGLLIQAARRRYAGRSQGWRAARSPSPNWGGASRIAAGCHVGGGHDRLASGVVGTEDAPTGDCRAPADDPPIDRVARR